MNKRILLFALIAVVFLIAAAVTSCALLGDTVGGNGTTAPAFTETDVAYISVDGGVPHFSDSEKNITEAFESYSDLDYLGRCGVAFACVGKETMPTQERGAIGSVKPTGWHSVRYDFVDGKYLYNRCHLIGYQLTGENANEKNLITGTRYLNTVGMLPFENMVADYVKETGNHVLYRVTPVFEGKNLVASGVYIEAYSVEDNGDGVCFFVYVYNRQPGVEIDYLTGESRSDGTLDGSGKNATSAEKENRQTYILNTSNGKFHLPDCGSVGKISDKNKQVFEGTRSELINAGYSPCGACKP